MRNSPLGILVPTLLLLMAAMTAHAAPPRGKKQAAKPRAVNIKVNIQEVVDSALLMADDYATALVQKPEFAPTRLNVLKKYYTSLPSDAARDSVRSRIFDFYINYVEAGKTGQADAFKTSFLAIAPVTDEHLGPLYANELIVAQENFDTTKIKSELPLLIDYAERLNVDYDEIIHQAQDFLHFMRTKEPIQKALTGVWVGEGIYRDIYKYEYKLTEFRRAHHILSITENQIMSVYPEQFLIYDYFRAANTSTPESIVNASIGNLFGKVKQNELKYKKKKLDIQISPRQKIYFEDLRGAYCVYSSEYINSFDAAYFAKARQNMQNQVARTHGELARSGTTFGKKLVGTVASNSLMTLGNTIIDRLAVSEAHYWYKELNIHLYSPVKLTVSTFFQYNTVKSNSNYVHKRDWEEPDYEYYKWTPADDIFFLYMSQSGLKHLYIDNPSKDKKKERKNLVKEYQKKYKDEGHRLSPFSNADYRDFLSYFNKAMFNKLKALRENEL